MAENQDLEDMECQNAGDSATQQGLRSSLRSHEVVTAQPAAVADTVYRHSDVTDSQGSAGMGSAETLSRNLHGQHNHQTDQKEEEESRSTHDTGPEAPAANGITNPSGAEDGAGSKQSTPDAAKVYIRVDWQGHTPQKCKKDLERNLQTWATTSLKKEVGKDCSFTDLKYLSDEDQETYVEVEITPSAALDILKKIKNTEIQFKRSNIKIKVEFLENKPNNVREFTESRKKQKNFESSQNSSGTDDVPVHDSAVIDFKGNVMVKPQISTGPSGENHPPFMKADGTEGAVKDVIKSEFTVPFFQFWYLTQAYSKELEDVLRTSRVHMEAEVSVRLTPKENSTSASVDEAVQKLTDLVSKATNNLSSVEIPHSDLESDIMKEVQRNIPTTEKRMVMRTSADNSLLFAPESITSMVKNQLHRAEQSSGNYGASGSSTSYQTSKPIKVSIKDPPAPLQIAQVHWMMMNTVFQEQISNLQSKYGVLFLCETGNGSTQVTAQSTGTHQHNLEAQALTALMKLYQKVVSSTFTCELDDPSSREMVVQGFERIRSKHPSVGAGDDNGRWKLIGLQHHLVPAVHDLEKIVGRSVFDSQTKSKLGSASDFPAEGRDSDFNTKDKPESSGLNRQPTRAKDLKVKEEEEDNCPICMDSFTDQKKLQCGHKFCRDCLDQSERALGKICSVCKQVYGTLRGNQPKGQMSVRHQSTSLPGFPRCGSIVIDYSIPSGTQTSEHPNPGRPFNGTQRTAYLPDNQEGKQVLQLLQRAFDQRLIFTVGTSRTTGADNTVIWNDIHHKTSFSGSFGYPDPDYFRRVREELKAKGIE